MTVTFRDCIESAGATLSLAKGYLSASQLQEVEESIRVGEVRLAMEFLADFLSDNEREIPRALYESLISSLVLMNSTRVDMPYLRSLVSSE